MAQNSFTVRGWCITLVTALVAFATQSQSAVIALSGLIPVALFWALDAYYLRQERGFRVIFDAVRAKREDEIDYAMLPKYGHGLLFVMFRSTIFFCLYGGLVILICAIAWIIHSSGFA